MDALGGFEALLQREVERSCELNCAITEDDTSDILRIELRLHTADKIKNVLDSNYWEDLDDQKIEYCYRKLITDRWVKEYAKWRKRRCRELKKLIKSYRATHKRDWHYVIMDYIRNRAEEDNVPFILDIEQIQGAYRDLLEEYREELGMPIPASLAEAREMFRDHPQTLAVAEAAVWLCEKFGDGIYRDIPGLCRRVSRVEIAEHEYSLNPAVYVGPAEKIVATSGWEEIRLGDLGDLCDGINFKADAYGAGTRIIMGTDFQSRTYPDYESLGQVRAECVRPGYELQDGDIVIARSNGTAGLVGRCMLIRNLPCPVTFAHNCIRFRVKNRTKYDPEFLTYLLKTKAFRSAMAFLAKDGTTKNLSQKSIAAYTVSVPDIHRQRQIAAVLRGFDAKIEVGEQQIRHLQEEAARMFEEQFGGADSGNCIPTPLKELLELHYDQKPVSGEPGEIPLYSSRGILRHVAEATMDGEYILIPRKGNLGHVMLVRGRFSANETLYCGRPKRTDVTLYLYHYLLSYGIEKLDAGLQKPQINLKCLNTLQIPMPAEEVLRSFENTAGQCYQMISDIKNENRTLIRERDDMIEKLFCQ